MRIYRKLTMIWVLACVLLSSLVFAVPVQAAALRGTTNAEKLFNYFYDKGYSAAASAAIVGNVMWESGSDGDFNFPLYNIEAGGYGEGIGMCQWSYERKADFINYCVMKGTPWYKSSLKTQAEFLEKELKSKDHWMFPTAIYSSSLLKYKHSFEEFKKMTDVEQAVGTFCFCLERPSEYYARLTRRIMYAESVLKAFYKELKPTALKTVKPSGDNVELSWSSAQGATKYRVYIYDSSWKNVLTYTTKHTAYKAKNLKDGIYYVRTAAMNPRGDQKFSGYHAFSIGNSSQESRIKPVDIKASQIDYKTIQLKWNPVDSASSYVVYRRIAGETYRKYHTTYSTSLKASAKAGLKYSFKIKTYIQNKRGVIESEYSDTVIARTKLEGAPVLKIKANGSKRFTLSWSKVSGATRYIVYRKQQGSAYKRLKTLKDVSTYTTANLAKGQYSFCVKAARYDGDERVFSKASNEKSGTIK